MNDQEIFDKFVGKNGWAGLTEINLTAEQLKKIILTACKYAREDGFLNGQNWEKRQNKMAGRNSDPMNVFGDIFNKK